MRETAQNIDRIVREASDIVIVSHENPDGDAIGSALAWSALLEKLGKRVMIWFPTRFPHYYAWMNGSDKIRFYTDNQNDIVNDLLNAQVLFAVDISTLSRTGRMAKVFDQFTGTRVLIDHHIDPAVHEFDHLFSDTTVSSTCELMFHLMVMAGLDQHIDYAIAEALYVGIMTDTGSFSFNCNMPATYEVVAQLVRKGISTDRIHKLVYDTNHEGRIRLLGYALQKMTILKELHTAFISLDREELQAAGSQPGDTEGIVNFALSVKNVVLAAFFSMRDGEVKISFRSKGNFSVNDFAKSHFNGGGHFNASGGSFKGTVSEAVELFKSVLPLYKDALHSCNESF